MIFNRSRRFLQALADHVHQVVALLESAGGTAGSLVTDAQIAAAALSHRAVVRV